MAPRVRAVTGAMVVMIGAISSLTACGDDTEGGAAAFCAEIDASKRQLTKPKLRTEADVAAYLELYRDIGELSPLAIGREWDDLTTNWETAATVDPDDPDSVERAKAKAYATEGSAATVKAWLRQNCGVDLGPVTTIVPHDNRTAPASTTTSTVAG